jgi:hypothetical protein
VEEVKENGAKSYVDTVIKVGMLKQIFTNPLICVGSKLSEKSPEGPLNTKQTQSCGFPFFLFSNPNKSIQFP